MCVRMARLSTSTRRMGGRRNRRSAKCELVAPPRRQGAEKNLSFEDHSYYLPYPLDQQTGSARGKVSTKLAPISIWFVRHKSPPISWARRRLRAKPRPTPGAELAASCADLLN